MATVKAKKKAKAKAKSVPKVVESKDVTTDIEPSYEFIDYLIVKLREISKKQNTIDGAVLEIVSAYGDKVIRIPSKVDV